MPDLAERRAAKDVYFVPFLFMFQNIWVALSKGSILWQTIRFCILNRAYTNKVEMRREHSYMASSLLSKLLHWARCQIFHLLHTTHRTMTTHIHIYYMYVVQGTFLAWPCTMGPVSHPNWLKNIPSFLCGFD